MLREVKVGLLVIAAFIVLGVGVFLVSERRNLFTLKNQYSIQFQTVSGLGSASSGLGPPERRRSGAARPSAVWGRKLVRTWSSGHVRTPGRDALAKTRQVRHFIRTMTQKERNAKVLIFFWVGQKALGGGRRGSKSVFLDFFSHHFGKLGEGSFPWGLRIIIF